MQQIIIDALIHAIKEIIIFFFVTPYRLWIKACEKLAAQKKNKTLNLSEINSLWPFFTFLKRFNFDFFFDACIVLAYPFGVVFAIISLFSFGMREFIVLLVAYYYAPLWIAWFRDLCQVLLIPFRKFLNWGSKPAQYMDLNITKEK